MQNVGIFTYPPVQNVGIFHVRNVKIFHLILLGSS